ncbi:LysR family transcriptional regulator [Nitratireductor thuwali]|uniref:HTH-type transcriptional activator CmpR n=1 Tax=Nitratireductor thuwali TaxID=2267699 RepID=A0ABY5MI20_9HYPH|nr:HTH-type transcriptional activator CmpR [Nitratireductor thuwali]
MKDYPNLRHVRLFCACLQRGSVSRAAEEIGLTQAAASQALARFEAIFGRRLIDRQNGAPAATPEGRIVLARARRALDLIQAGCGRLPGADRNAASRLTIAHMRALAAFAARGSFSAAARLLGQSEPAVHRAARDAEASLNVPLFEGAGRAIRLSPLGRSAARWSRLALNELENAGAELGESEGRFEGRVPVGTLPLTRTSLVPRAIARVASRHPQAQFEIVEGRYDALVGDLEDGRIDLIVGALRGAFPARSLVQEDLFTYCLAVVAGRGHPLLDRNGLSIADLADYPWVVAREGTPSREVFSQMAAHFPPDRPPRCTVEAGSLVAIRGLLLHSHHLALLSRHQIRYDMEAGFLRPLDVELPPHARSVGITYRRHWMATALQAEFIDALRDAAAEAGA